MSKYCLNFQKQNVPKTTFKKMKNESSIPRVVMMYLVCAPDVGKQKMGSLGEWLP